MSFANGRRLAGTGLERFVRTVAGLFAKQSEGGLVGGNLLVFVDRIEVISCRAQRGQIALLFRRHLRGYRQSVSCCGNGCLQNSG